MRTSTFTFGLLTVILLTAVSISKATDVSGPLTVCPKGTYTYTVSNLPFDANLVQYFVRLDSPIAQPFVSGTVPSSGQFTVTFNSNDIGPAYIHVKVTRYIPFLASDVFLQADRKLPIPASPGTIIVCGPNEPITVTSSPYIPYNPGDPNNPGSCLFHCAYVYNAPTNWLFTRPSNGNQENPLTLGDDHVTLTSPGSVTNGNAGSLTVTALFSQCGYSINTQSYGSVFVGTPTLSNPTVNGSSSQTPNYINGSAFLVVTEQGAPTINWQIDGGSGYIQPNYNSCNASTDNFVRVRASTSNRCGQGQSHTFYLQNSSYRGYQVYPNPAKSVVKIEFGDAKYAEDLVQGITIFDEKGEAVKLFDIETATANQYFKDKNYVEFDVSKYKRGEYYVQVNIGGQNKAAQLKIE